MACRYKLFNPVRFYSQMRPSVSSAQVSQLKEEIILVTENDKVIGPVSKRDAHTAGINNKGLLHRAFSVFLFNSNNELLIQQRSSTKILFPEYFTNTCCSHQRYNKEEMETKNYCGTRLAAKRRMEFELGVSLPIQSYNFITRIYYWSPSDEYWCEHEVDHVLICKADVDLSNVNPDEVQNTLFLNKVKLKDFVENSRQNNVLITPWFRYIYNNLLYTWWNGLDDLEKFKNIDIYMAGYQVPN